MGNIPSVSPGQLATADQYNALQAGLNPLVENEYTSWKLITNVASSAQSSTVIAQNILMDEISGIIYFVDWDNAYLWSMNIDGTGLTQYANLTAYMQPQIYMNTVRSILGKYIVALNVYSFAQGSTDLPLVVFKKGAIQQTITLGSHQATYNTSGHTIYSPNVFISRTGQYIVVVGADATTSTIIRIQVYEGQS